jgi:hypothetical protein
MPDQAHTATQDHVPTRSERFRALYVLANGWAIELPALLRVGDRVAISGARGRGWFSKTPRVETEVAAEDAISAPMSTSLAFDTLSRELLGAKCKGVTMRENGDIVFGLDVDHYADLKERLGYGITKLPLDPDEAFHHGRFVFCIVASHAWQRDRDPSQPLS